MLLFRVKMLKRKSLSVQCLSFLVLSDHNLNTSRLEIMESKAVVFCIAFNFICLPILCLLFHMGVKLGVSH